MPTIDELIKAKGKTIDEMIAEQEPETIYATPVEPKELPGPQFMTTPGDIRPRETGLWSDLETIGEAVKIFQDPTTPEGRKLAQENIYDRLKWAVTYYASLGGRLGPKGLRKELREEAEEFGGFGPALMPVAGETGTLAIEWGWLYPKLFKLVGVGGSQISRIPKVGKGIRALKSMGGIAKVAEKQPHLYSAGTKALTAFMKGEVVGQTMAAVESLGKDKPIEEWIVDMNKRGALLGGVATAFSVANSIDQHRYITATARHLRLNAYNRHVERVNKGMLPKHSAEMARREGRKIDDVIYYLEQEMLGAPAELYGGKKPELSPQEAAKALARHGYVLGESGKTARQLSTIRKPSKPTDVLLRPEPITKGTVYTAPKNTYREAYNPQTGQRHIIPEGMKVVLPKGYEISEPISLKPTPISELLPPIKTAEQFAIFEQELARSTPEEIVQQIPDDAFEAEVAEMDAELREIQRPAREKPQIVTEKPPAEAVEKPPVRPVEARTPEKPPTVVAEPLAEKPISLQHKQDILNEFEQDRATLMFESTCVDCEGGAEFVDAQMDKSQKLAKNSLPVKELIKQEYVEKRWLKDWEFYINDNYVIGVHSAIEHFYKIESPYLESITEEHLAPAPAEPTVVKPAEVELTKKELRQREIEAETEEAGISPRRRNRLLKETAKRIAESDIYQVALEGLEGGEIGPGYYYVPEKFRSEVEDIIGERKRGVTRLQKMFTFDPHAKIIVDTPSGKAEIGPLPWDTAVQQALGRGREGIEETAGMMDISDFAQRVKDSVEAEEEVGGLSQQALERAYKSGDPYLQYLITKQEMLRDGKTVSEIDEMTREWAEQYGLDESAIENEFLGPEPLKIKEIRALPEAERDAAVEALARENVLRQERQEAKQAVNEVLEANDLEVEVEEVAEIEEGEEVPFERRGKPTGAAIITPAGREIVQLAYGADSETGYHEAYHTLRRHLTAKDKKVLDMRFKGDEEAEAREFAEFAKTGKTKVGYLRGIWRKLVEKLKKIKSALQGRGYRTAQDIFGEIQRGVVPKEAVRPGAVQFERMDYNEILKKQRELEGLAAAMRDPKTGKVYTGHTHQVAIDKAPRGGDVWSRLSDEWDKGTDNTGFVDKNGKFISRSEAEKRWNVLTMEDVRDARKIQYEYRGVFGQPIQEQLRLPFKERQAAIKKVAVQEAREKIAKRKAKPTISKEISKEAATAIAKSTGEPLAAIELKNGNLITQPIVEFIHHADIVTKAGIDIENVASVGLVNEQGYATQTMAPDKAERMRLVRQRAEAKPTPSERRQKYIEAAKKTADYEIYQAPSPDIGGSVYVLSHHGVKGKSGQMGISGWKVQRIFGNNQKAINYAKELGESGKPNIRIIGADNKWHARSAAHKQAPPKEVVAIRLKPAPAKPYEEWRPKGVVPIKTKLIKAVDAEIARTMKPKSNSVNITPEEIDRKLGGLFGGADLFYDPGNSLAEVQEAFTQLVKGGPLIQFESQGDQWVRESMRKARIKAEKERLKAKVKPKVSRARLKIKLRDVTPVLRKDFKPEITLDELVAEPRDVKPKQKIYLTDKWFQENIKPHRKKAAKRPTSMASRSLKLLDKVLGSSSTRLYNIHPELFRQARRYAFDVMTRSTDMVAEVEPFLKAMKKMSKDDYKMFDLALKNGYERKINELVAKYGLEKEYSVVRDVLDDLYNAAKEVGIDMEYRKEYWHRHLKDPEGFLEYFQKGDDWSIIEEAIKRRAERAGRTIEELTDEEKAQVVNTLLRGYRIEALTLARPGAAKARTVEVIDADLNQFYDDSATAMVKYIRLMNRKIAEREFFGKETKEITDLRKLQSARLTRLLKLQRRRGLKERTTEGKYKEHISKTAENWKAGQERLQRLTNASPENTIGGYVMDLQRTGQIKPTQEKELRDILQGVFYPRGMGRGMGLFATGVYIDTLNSPLQALTQLDEFAYSYFRSPTKSVPVAIRTTLRRSKITPKDIGITSIGQEFQGPSMRRALSTMLKATGFEQIDRLNKENYINTALATMQAQAKGKPSPTLIKRLVRVFGKDYKNVLEDLRKPIRSMEDVSNDVKYLLFNQLLDIQPVAITEMPEAYNKAGNMRILYALKTFYMKRLDFIRTECWQDMKHIKTFPKGFGKLVWLAFSFALFGAVSDALKDFIRGKKFNLKDSVYDNMLRMVFSSKFQVMQISKEGAGRAHLEQWVPPTKAIDAVSKDVVNVAKGKDRGFELWRSVPLVGELYYWWFGRGREKIEAKKGKGWSEAEQ